MLNPNTGRNTVLTPDEIDDVRCIVGFSEKMVQKLDRKLEDGHRNRNDLLHRQNKHNRILHGIRSELWQKDSIIKEVEQEKSTAESELRKLYGMIHPIHRCHSDITRYIFEWVV